MRFVQFVIASLVVIAGLVGALLLVVVGFVLFVLRRLFGRPAAMPQFQASFRRAPGRPASPRRDDVIDVIATDVKADSARSQSRLNG